ncbi:hypothetical protein PFUGPA_01821 [Plasmodium falciparum Palo Alto/Uganda]|uniref:Uncharacterized protein n=1 Tax=Plasmodium falciparum (isolate Palo Alto / Uganda) TaxID=57270 RepID=W4J1S3_PLAFP|nr:hypothetical protein PFUGPA_01821 [Plasmodium falciparum Palo Alto/Uganda]
MKILIKIEINICCIIQSNTRIKEAIFFSYVLLACLYHENFNNMFNKENGNYYRMNWYKRIFLYNTCQYINVIINNITNKTKCPLKKHNIFIYENIYIHNTQKKRKI